MEWITSVKDWASDNSTMLWWLGGLSLALLVLSPLVAGWLIVRLPADYFTTKHRRPLESWDGHPVLRVALLVTKNLIGVALLVAGLAMLLAPGQGLLTIVVGVLLVDFPGKFRVQRWLVTRKQVWRSINWLRKRAGRPELKRPTDQNPAGD
jgi:hypothetical protein